MMEPLQLQLPQQQMIPQQVAVVGPPPPPPVQNPLPIASHLQLQQMALQNEQLQNEQLIERQVAGHNSHVKPRIVRVVQVVQVVGHPPPPSQHHHQRHDDQHQYQPQPQQHQPQQEQQEQQPYGGQVQSVKVVNDGKTCAAVNCSKSATRRYCESHGGGGSGKGSCSTPNCTTKAVARGLCSKHGANGKCSSGGCSSNAVARGFCRKHDGKGKGVQKERCSQQDCNQKVRVYNLCAAHGQGYICVQPKCRQPAKHVSQQLAAHQLAVQTALASGQSIPPPSPIRMGSLVPPGASQYCSRHSGGEAGRGYCTFAGCTTRAVARALCSKHGANGTCKTENCNSNAVARGYCRKHDTKVKQMCIYEDCTAKAHVRKLCVKHGTTGTCAKAGCPRNAVAWGVCVEHVGDRSKDKRGAVCAQEVCSAVVPRGVGFCGKHSVPDVPPSEGVPLPPVPSNSSTIHHGGQLHGNVGSARVQPPSTLQLQTAIAVAAAGVAAAGAGEAAGENCIRYSSSTKRQQLVLQPQYMPQPQYMQQQPHQYVHRPDDQDAHQLQFF